MYVKNSVLIQGHRGDDLAVSATAAATDVLEAGVYDVVCDVDVSVRVSAITTGTTDRAQDVTRANGYRVAAGNSVAIEVGSSCKIGAIADGAGTLYFHKVG